MSSKEFTEWMAYDRIDPFGLERLDLGHAIVSSTLANLFGRKDNNDPIRLPQEFMPKFIEESSEEKVRRAVENMMKPPPRISQRRVKR